MCINLASFLLVFIYKPVHYSCRELTPALLSFFIDKEKNGKTYTMSTLPLFNRKKSLEFHKTNFCEIYNRLEDDVILSCRHCNERYIHDHSCKYGKFNKFFLITHTHTYTHTHTHIHTHTHTSTDSIICWSKFE